MPSPQQIDSKGTSPEGKGTRASRLVGKAPSQLDPIQLSDVIENVPIGQIKPAKINDVMYKPVSLEDPTIIALGEEIKAKGLLEAIVVTIDNVIVSGHRRRGGCLVAGLSTVPVRRISIASHDPRFPDYLRAFNKQRIKTPAELIREEVTRISPEDAHNALLALRKTESTKVYKRVEESGLRILKTTSASKRSAITSAKHSMLKAAIAVIEKYEDHWPLTLRQIHYRLLGKSVIRNDDRGTFYENTTNCYQDLSDLLTRARLSDLVPWESMHDPTRPSTRWRQWESVATYVQQQLDGFMANYKRNLLQSQPAYVELIVEKLTVLDIAERAAGHYHVPVGVGRGYTSVTSLDETADRILASDRDRAVLLIAGDLDPEGENICESWGNCLRYEHGVENLTMVKIGVNPDQVEQYNLASVPVKESSSRASGFKAKHGNRAYELEAFEPDQLQALIRDAIRNVLDLKAFAEEQKRESEDARQLMAYRSQVIEFMRGCRIPDAGDVP
jgi:hypothetical protein